jgi:hypothetical protein
MDGILIIRDLLKKRCRILPVGGLGVSPSYKKSPKIGGYRGLIKTTSAFSYNKYAGRLQVITLI